MSEENNELIEEEEEEELDLSPLSDDELVPQMHDDLYDGLKEEIMEDIFAQRIPKCSKCDAIDESAVMKPDIVFFGEPLDDEYYDTLNDDLGEVDLLIMIGSSLKVNPVANIPQSISSSVPQVFKIGLVFLRNLFRTFFM